MDKAHWTQHTHLFKKDEYECPVCGAMYDKPYAVCSNCNSQMGKAKYDASWVMKWLTAMGFLATRTTEIGRKVKGGESSGKEKRRFIWCTIIDVKDMKERNVF